MNKQRKPGILLLLMGCVFTALWIGNMDFSHLRTVDYVQLSAIAMFFICGAIMVARNWRSWRNMPSDKNR